MEVEPILGRVLGGTIAALFEAMEWAEEEITAAKVRHPAKAAEIDGAFLICKPEMEMPEALYRRHVRELLARVARGHDTRDATDAEVLGGLVALSKRAPLAHFAGLLFEELFQRLFPDEARRIEEQHSWSRGSRGVETDDLEEKLRSELRRPDRRVAG